MRKRTFTLWAIGLGLALSPLALGGESPLSGLPLEGQAAETFLREARVLSMEPIGVGITKPMRVTLTDGLRTHRAVWKTIDELRKGVHRNRKGGFQPHFRDSYRYEIAAYELDKLLGLGLVPPTVEREIEGKKGSLQMWVEGAFTELDRRERGLAATDKVAWSDHIYKLKLFHQLVYNEDAHNLRNVIYDRQFRAYAIDNSRSFRTYHRLVEASHLVRFSRSLLAELRDLDASASVSGKLDALKPWLSDSEIEALLVRRDKLLDRAAALGDLHGEDRVLYP